MMETMAFVWVVAGLGAVHAVAGVAAIAVIVRGGRLDGARLLWCGALAAVVVAGSTWLAWERFKLTAFEMLAVLYVDLAMVLPVVGSSLLYALWRVRGEAGWRAWASVGRVLGVCAVVPVPVAAWATLVEPNVLVVERAAVSLGAARKPSRPIRVAVVTDVQNARIGAQERRVLARLREIDPDVIVIPGDLFQPATRVWSDFQSALDEVAGEFRGFLSEVGEIAPAFFTPGNCEWWYDDLSLVEGTGVEYLVWREPGVVEVGGRRVLVFGAGYELTSRTVSRTISRIDAVARDEDIVVLASHRPDTVLVLPERARPDLTVAGHTHGGQVRVPWFGPIMTGSAVPRRVAGGGLHTVNENRVYVSRGVGVERGHSPPLRFNCLPEVSLIELR